MHWLRMAGAFPGLGRVRVFTGPSIARVLSWLGGVRFLNGLGRAS